MSIVQSAVDDSFRWLITGHSDSRSSRTSVAFTTPVLRSTCSASRSWLGRGSVWNEVAARRSASTNSANDWRKSPITVPAGRSSSTAHCTVTADLDAVFSADVIAEGFPCLYKGFPDDVIADDSFLCPGSPSRARLSSGIRSLLLERVSLDDVIAEGFPCIVDDVNRIRAIRTRAALTMAIAARCARSRMTSEMCSAFHSHHVTLPDLWRQQQQIQLLADLSEIIVQPDKSCLCVCQCVNQGGVETVLLSSEQNWIGLDWIEQGLTSHSTHFMSFRRRWGDCGISQDCSRSQSPQCVRWWVVWTEQR